LPRRKTTIRPSALFRRVESVGLCQVEGFFLDRHRICRSLDSTKTAMTRTATPKKSAAARRPESVLAKHGIAVARNARTP
jgi:hypothetical protein